jgi:hypothetical protein
MAIDILSSNYELKRKPDKKGREKLLKLNMNLIKEKGMKFQTVIGERMREKTDERILPNLDLSISLKENFIMLNELDVKVSLKVLRRIYKDNDIKDYTLSERLDQIYNKNVSLKENKDSIAVLYPFLKIGKQSLYDYCNDRNIPTNPNKVITTPYTVSKSNKVSNKKHIKFQNDTLLCNKRKKTNIIQQGEILEKIEIPIETKITEVETPKDSLLKADSEIVNKIVIPDKDKIVKPINNIEMKTKEQIEGQRQIKEAYHALTNLLKVFRATPEMMKDINKEALDTYTLKQRMVIEQLSNRVLSITDANITISKTSLLILRINETYRNYNKNQLKPILNVLELK